MGWRTVNGRKYFYHSYRHYGEVRTTYLGNGRIAEAEAKKLEQRKQDRMAFKRAIADIARLREFGEESFRRIELLIKAALAVAGYYQHCRGAWRRRRFKVPEDYPVLMPPVIDWKELIRQSNGGDPGAVATMRHCLRENPIVWQEASDLTSRAIEARIQRITRGDTLLAESIRLRVKEFRKSLASPKASVVEQMAIDGVVLSWVEVHQAELAAQVERNLPYKQFSRPLENAAWRRYFAAMRLLIFVREKLPEVEQTCEELQPTPLRSRDAEDNGPMLPTSRAAVNF